MLYVGSQARARVRPSAFVLWAVLAKSQPPKLCLLAQMFQLFQELFNLLPLATLVNRLQQSLTDAEEAEAAGGDCQAASRTNKRQPTLPSGAVVAAAGQASV